ncbi:hypothetical protein LIS82_26865 (plasmid) [Cytobacillus solani]|uniref:hypothetical protein n=1 Tax=Cytobacillus solani TaxID=1637975 RepID=UPI00207A201B|nr:hypothetical protein [Cytobacillus solani]USK57843.1 hypothetical protein LIS82_26865 [Cytobacillus solani]
MKKLIIKLSFLGLLLSLAPICSYAESLEKLPATETSKQWEIVIGKPNATDPSLNKSDQPDLYNVYSMVVNNISNKDNVELVRIEVYRDHPNSATEYELFTVDYEGEKPLKPALEHLNFPLYTKASKLKVIVTWSEKNDQTERKYKEQFVFKQ